MELREYWRIIRQSLWLILVIPIVAAMASYYYAHKMSRPIIEATATLLTTVGQNQAPPDSTTLSTIVSSQAFDNAVVQQFSSLIISPTEMSGLVVVQTRGSLIYVTAGGPNEHYAATVANAVAQTLVNDGNLFNLPTASIINPANPLTPPIVKSSKKSIVMSSVIGLILALGIAFMREYLDMRIKTEADLSRFLNIPVLGTVQEYKIKQRKTGKS